MQKQEEMNKEQQLDAIRKKRDERRRMKIGLRAGGAAAGASSSDVLSAMPMGGSMDDDKDQPEPGAENSSAPIFKLLPEDRTFLLDWLAMARLQVIHSILIHGVDGYCNVR